MNDLKGSIQSLSLNWTLNFTRLLLLIHCVKMRVIWDVCYFAWSFLYVYDCCELINYLNSIYFFNMNYRILCWYDFLTANRSKIHKTSSQKVFKLKTDSLKKIWARLGGQYNLRNRLVPSSHLAHFNPGFLNREWYPAGIARLELFRLPFTV